MLQRREPVLSLIGVVLGPVDCRGGRKLRRVGLRGLATSLRIEAERVFQSATPNAWAISSRLWLTVESNAAVATSGDSSPTILPVLNSFSAGVFLTAKRRRAASLAILFGNTPKGFPFTDTGFFF